MAENLRPDIKADIDQVNKKDGKQIADTIRGRLAGPARQPEPQTPDVYEQL